MPRPRLRSRSIRRVKVKVPGGRVSLQYRKQNPKQSKCASCKKILHGIPRFSRTQAKNTAKSKKRPQRPFGGQLCSSCSRKIFVKKALGDPQ